MVHSIQYDPNRSARIALLHYVDGEKRYILAPDGLKAGDRGGERSGCAADGWQLPAVEADSVGHGDPQHRVAAGPGRRACAAVPAPVRRWRLARPTGPRSTCPAARFAVFRRRCRATIGKIGNSDHMGIRAGQGRPQAVAGAPAARPRHGDESDRPSARWRRRSHQGRSSSGQPDGQAGQGRLDAEEAQAVECGDRAAAPVASDTDS